MGIYLLANLSFCSTFTDYARRLLVHFVQQFSELYGSHLVVYNIHGLIHLPDVVRNHGPLDSFSAFPFENYLGKVKKVSQKANLCA